MKRVSILELETESKIKLEKEIEMTTQARVEDILIPIFNGVNFTSWKLRLMLLLEYKECKEQVLRNKTDEDTVADWNKKDLKAKMIITSTVSDRQLEYIGECTTAYDMMKKFNGIYTSRSTALQIVQRGKIEDIKLNNYTEVDEFFVDFEKSINNFKSAGGALDEAEKMRYLIKALPTSYSYIGDFIDVVPEDQRTVDYVKSKIKEKNINKTEVNKRSHVSTFNTRTQGQCFVCGKRGHQKRDCYYNKNNQNGEQVGQGRGAQHNQGKGQRGHPNDRFSRGYGRSSGTHRGYSRGRGSYQPTNESTSRSPESQSCAVWSTVVQQSEVNHVKRYEFENSKDNEKVINWILDSGCTDHIIKTDKYFVNFVNLKTPVDVKLPDGKTLKATKLGSIKAIFKNYYKEKTIAIKNVYYVKGIKKNLLSLSKISKNNTIVAKNNSVKIYDQNRELVAVAKEVDNLYFMTSYVTEINETKEIYTNVAKLTDKEKWHRTLGHVNFKYLKKLVNDKLLEGLPEKIENTEMKCANCIQSKMSNVPFENNRRTKTKEILELIHTDLNGPHIIGYGGEKYFLTFVDDYSKCTRLYCIKNKSDVANCFKDYVNFVENKFNKRVKKLQSDNGREYLNREIYDFIRDKGIEILTCPPYVHELNGVAERYNRSAMDMGRCLMREAKVNRRYWPEIMKAVAYLKNRTLANTLENKTPYEIFFSIKPNVKHPKIYGSRAFVRIPEALRKSKWDDKAKIGVLIGYSENGYRVLVNNRVMNVRHVEIVEDKTELICLEKIDDVNNNRVTNESVDDNLDKESVQSEICMSEDLENETFLEEQNLLSVPLQHCADISESQNDLEQENDENIQTLRKSTRKKSPVNRLGNPISHFIYVNYITANVPCTFEEATNCREHKEWKRAMDSEIQSLNKNNTWKIVDRPKNNKIIDVKWVYKKKSDGKHKARLVVRGFQQKDYIENVYSPVGKMQTLKTLLAYSCSNNLYIEQMDVETAFLNGQVKTEVYVNMPEGYEKNVNRVYKLQKALYGLRESPRAWYDCLNEFLKNIGFVRSNYDYCLYINNTNQDPIYILVFVDDLLICCKHLDKIKEIKISLMERFSMKDMGKIGSYIGIDIDYNDERNKMTLSQTQYIESLAAKYNLEGAKLYDTPMETNLRLEQASETNEKIKYRNLIGELLYISTGTRPDITYSVNYLSRFQNCYNDSHFKYAMRIIKYLYKTKDLKLTYTENLGNEILDCMVDSDFAGDSIDRKSTTGFVIRLYGNSIFWKTHKQNSVVKCSTFAEYTAMSEAVTEILFVRNLLIESFKLNLNEPIKLYVDNTGAIAIGKFGNFTKNSKHIEVQYHYISENYEKGVIDIVKVDSNRNLADIFTKSLSKLKFLNNRHALRLI